MTRGRVEDPRRSSGSWSTAAAPARGRWRRGAERPHPGDHREVDGEPPQVPRARAAPAVDGLARVADRGHRVPAAEQRPQQHQLGVAGVLVLVQQHHLVAGPLGRADLRVRGRRSAPRGRPGRRGRGPRGPPWPPRTARPAGSSCSRARWVSIIFRTAPGTRPGSASSSALSQRPTRGHVAGLAQVLGQVAGQVEHGRGHRLRGPDDLVHRPVVGGHDPAPRAARTARA